MEPTQKTDEIEATIDQITPNPLGRRGSILADVCAWCGKPAQWFRDDLSCWEYRISGLCQTCQDETFGRPGEEPIDA